MSGRHWRRWRRTLAASQCPEGHSSALAVRVREEPRPRLPALPDNSHWTAPRCRRRGGGGGCRDRCSRPFVFRFLHPAYPGGDGAPPSSREFAGKALYAARCNKPARPPPVLPRGPLSRSGGGHGGREPRLDVLSRFPPLPFLQIPVDVVAHHGVDPRVPEHLLRQVTAADRLGETHRLLGPAVARRSCTILALSWARISDTRPPSIMQ
jgi:hypothetical protein